MSVIADVTVPAQSFALQETLTAAPKTTIEAERLASHSAEWVLPFLWASGDDSATFHQAIEDDSTVDTATIIEEANDSTLYQITWKETVINLINEMIDQHATILEAEASTETWRLKLQFAEEDQVSSFRDHFTERGYSFEVNRFYHSSAPRQREFGLTAEQYDTLVTAFQIGYFNIPRDSTIEELADCLNISSNATSQRIRRASANLIQHTLLIGTDASDARE